MNRSASVAAALFLFFRAGAALAVCNVSATGVSFGAYDVFSVTPLDSTGSVTVSCDEAPAPVVVITIGPSGVSGGFNPRALGHSSLPDRLNYNLFVDPGMSVAWGDGTAGTSTVTLPKVKKKQPPRVTTIYGRIPARQDVSVGNYSDRLTVTITW